MTNPTPKADTAEKTRKREPLIFHLTAREDQTHLHTYCGDTIRKSTARYGKTMEEVRRSLCSDCAEMKRLHNQLDKDLQRELRVLKRYEVMLDALRELEEQEEQR